MRHVRMYEQQDQAQDQPVWQAFGEDMTQKARDGELDPVIGRAGELEQLIWILSRKLKNNPVLIGEPGVGKTAAVEKLAQLMASGDCPAFLEGKKLISIDLVKVAAAGKLRRLMQEVRAENLVLFMDEIHTIRPIADAIKPGLARGEFNLIGATTLSEYREYIEKDGALERRFQRIYVDEPSFQECLEILNGIKARYEQFHNVRYTDESIHACVKLSQRYITNRFLPDKAIDLMDEVGARVRMARTKNPRIAEIEGQIREKDVEVKRLSRAQNFEAAATAREQKLALEQQLLQAQQAMQGQAGEPPVEITKQMVEQVVSKKTRIPVHTMGQAQREHVKTLGARLKARVIGQDEAVNVVARAVQSTRVGLKDPKRPKGVFMFLGPTGVGKTELIKSLAMELFGSEDNMVRLDMSEYSEGHSMAKMFGSPPGYVGYGEGGQLTEKVRNKPYSVVLFDEIEKAHPKVHQSLLALFEDGFMTDGQGRKVDFRNTVIVMTSNVGVAAAASSRQLGFSTGKSKEVQANRQSVIMGELKKAFSPEFLNRIDQVIIFKSLDKDSLNSIVDLQLSKLRDRMAEQGMELTWTDNVRKLLVKHGYDPDMGARPLRRAIEQKIIAPLTDIILDDDSIKKFALDAAEVDDDVMVLKINDEFVKESRVVTRFSRFVPY